MTTKEKFKYFFKWTKSLLLEAFEQLQKKYQELEKQNKEQREEIIRLKAELEKIKIKSINLEVNKPSSKKPEWDKKGVGNDGKGNKNKGKGRGSKARKGAGNSRKDKKKVTRTIKATVDKCDNCDSDLTEEPALKSSNERIVEYLGRYTHRVAISNNRIKSIDNGQVCFEYRDRADNNTTKTMTVSAHEFIRRFLLHVLPHKFMKIRYFGFLSHRNKKQALKLIRKLIGPGAKIPQKIEETALEMMRRLIGHDLLCCPNCKDSRVNHHQV